MTLGLIRYDSIRLGCQLEHSITVTEMMKWNETILDERMTHMLFLYL